MRIIEIKEAPITKCLVKPGRCGSEELCSLTKSKFKEVVDSKLLSNENHVAFIEREIVRLEKDLKTFMFPKHAETVITFMRGVMEIAKRKVCENRVNSPFEYKRNEEEVVGFVQAIEWFSIFIHKYGKLKDFRDKERVMEEIYSRLSSNPTITRVILFETIFFFIKNEGVKLENTSKRGISDNRIPRIN